MNARAARSALFVPMLVACVALTGAWLAYRSMETPTELALCSALAREHIVQVFADEGVSLACQGVRVERLDAQVTQALALDDVTHLRDVLRGGKGLAIAVAPGRHERGVGRRLATYAYEPGLSAIALDPAVSVYEASDAEELGPKEREALAHVARALLRGAREPSLSSFPPSLRRVARLEVMVALLEHGEARLWRSARGTSIARALLTATRVARDRWHERETALGGPLRERLPELDVEVSLLTEDGTLTSSAPSFVDRAISKRHGVGFDHRGSWHYSMPNDVAKRGQGSPARALAALVRDQGLPESVLHEPDTRIYRFVPFVLGTSPAKGASSGSAKGSD